MNTSIRSLLRLPSVTGIARRKITAEFLRNIAHSAARPLAVLDIGSGIKTWQTELPPDRVARYDTVELKDDLNPTYVGDFFLINFNCTYDLIIATELLEHLPNPSQFFARARELLVPGGVVLISVPFLFKIHADPNDYFRYTDQGIRAMASPHLSVVDSHAHGSKFQVAWEVISDGKLLYPLRIINPLLASTKRTTSAFPLGYVILLR